MRRSLLTVLLALVCSGVGFTPSVYAIDWPFSSREEKPGSKEWWGRHKREAELVPGKGFRVPGFEGWYDGEGRPIDAPVDEIAIGVYGEDTGSKGILPGLDPKNAYNSIKTAVGLGPNEETARQALAEGEALFKEEKYSSAEGPLELAIARWPNSAVCEQAMFLLAECYYFQDQYRAARDAYDDLVYAFPGTRKLDTLVKRQWSIAQYWEAEWEKDQNYTLQPNLLDKTKPTFDIIGQAMKTYDSIRLNDPTGPWADDAIMATANSYFRRNRFFDADENYELLRREYPRSEHQFDAHLLGLQSKLRMYQGPDYDGTPLDDAQKLLKQLRVQFNSQLSSEERDRLRKVEAELQLAVDTRKLNMAQYYDELKEYGAAKIYYAELARDRSEAPVGIQAAERLIALGGLPEKPKVPLQDVIEMFPESRERAAITKLRQISEETRIANEQPVSGDAPITR
ncbi:Outer membrane protein assembly factor BamD [Pirellulimonas nuda]|uniref:Outer membrane protein assembly factor BamD n=1 Tax=Pirellulimonas nuda TaxID=2528009 RepID=A0A518D6F5_9BACT|nr:outer membrane protein assembly factor BamD [Pirellulimonas nuda]QDU87035.1 Outer membrane protein assembly factor BamD [Pirellulimonas nuda]